MRRQVLQVLDSLKSLLEEGFDHAPKANLMLDCCLLADSTARGN